MDLWWIIGSKIRRYMVMERAFLRITTTMRKMRCHRGKSSSAFMENYQVVVQWWKALAMKIQPRTINKVQVRFSQKIFNHIWKNKIRIIPVKKIEIITDIWQMIIASCRWYCILSFAIFSVSGRSLSQGKEWGDWQESPKEVAGGQCALRYFHDSRNRW